MKLTRPPLHLLFLLLAQLLGAFAAFADPPKAEEFKIDAKNVTLMGVRYANPGKPPAVLLHGFAENSRIWREFGYRMYARGFDVWMPNFRGHGNGEHFSAVKNYKKGDYGFIPTATEDMDAIVEHISLQTGGKLINMVGHSMGGMTSKLYVAGLSTTPEGQLFFDAAKAKWIAGHRIGNLVTLAAPNGFKNIPPEFKLLAHLLQPVTGAVEIAAPSVSDNRTPTLADQDGFFARAKKMIMTSVVDKAAAVVVPRGILDTSNLNKETQEFSRGREKALSPIHSDLVDSLGFFVKSEKYAAPDGLDLSTANNPLIPSLYGAADGDPLAPMKDIAREAISKGAKSLEVLGTSHVDITTGQRAAELVANPVADFFLDPTGYGNGAQRITVGIAKCSLAARLRNLIFK